MWFIHQMECWKKLEELIQVHEYQQYVRNNNLCHKKWHYKEFTLYTIFENGKGNMDCCSFYDYIHTGAQKSLI